MDIYQVPDINTPPETFLLNSWYGTPKVKNPVRDPARCTPVH